MVVLVVIAFLFVILLQMVSFFKKKRYKEAAVYFVLMAFTVIYAISGLTDWDFPAPDKLAETIFSPLSDFVFKANLRK